MKFYSKSKPGKTGNIGGSLRSRRLVRAASPARTKRLLRRLHRRRKGGGGAIGG
jgi:hypothetical protein